MFEVYSCDGFRLASDKGLRIKLHDFQVGSDIDPKALSAPCSLGHH
jgi:hypothetical protein